MIRCLFYFIFSCYSFTVLSANTITWKIQTSKPQSSSLLAIEYKMIEEINRESEGALNFVLKGHDGFVSPKSSYNALRTGQIDGMLMNPAYWTSADPVFAIMGDLVSAWKSPEQHLKWLEQGKGIQYLEKAYKRVGLKLLGYAVAPAESLVSNKRIANIEDIKGLVVRAPPGMINDFLKLLGAKTRNIDNKKILSSLENGRIDMADFSDLYVNNQLGAYRFAKHTTYPGFHSMPLYDFVVREETWNELNDKQQTIVLDAIEMWKVSGSELSKTQLDQAKIDVLAQGVTLYNWSDIELKKARKAAMIVWEKYAEKSDEAKALIDDIRDWLETEENSN